MCQIRNKQVIFQGNIIVIIHMLLIEIKDHIEGRNLMK